MKSIIKTISLLGILSLSIVACKDDDDTSVNPDTNVNPNEEELITTVELQFSDSLDNPIDTFYFKDVDGVGGNDPIIDSLYLSSNTTYHLSIRFLDESNPNDIEDITVEILEEDDEHLVCFNSDVATLDIEITDSDGTYPLGLASRWESGVAANGSLTLTLKHQPGVKNGNCDLGETDVEVNFPLIIQ